ncbi:hypothetical protein GEMRC1_002868 [Eukaryota sp. GEM-RC1]
MPSGCFSSQISKLAFDNAKSVTGRMIENTSPSYSPSYYNPDALLDSLTSEIATVLSDFNEIPESNNSPPGSQIHESSSVSPEQLSDDSPSIHHLSNFPYIHSEPPPSSQTVYVAKPLLGSSSPSPSSSPPRTHVHRLNSHTCTSKRSCSLKGSPESLPDPESTPSQVSKKVSKEEFGQVLIRMKQAEAERKEKIENLKREAEERKKQIYSSSPRINKISEKLAQKRTSLIERSSAQMLKRKEREISSPKTKR